ncbi:hypothetical protein ACIA2T_29125 [Amycolatopsis japonica]|uniref:hypothetical protein n=1 Tax=Amycolatopsis japonica TaxID=208439 RepID=UPI0037AC5263
MSQTDFQFHSPLSLLHEWEGRADGAPLREVLVTGFTLDLVFFERHCVSIARALGARITVLGDAAHAVHEAVDVRHAGRNYQHGQVNCGGAFHPKLVILTGDDDVWVAIGSGNPTMSGWGHNHELWLVIRASRRTGPQALHDLGAWLADLPRVVDMPSWTGDTVALIADWITPSAMDDALPGVRVFGNLRRSLIDQLPAGPVDSLRMTAPFFDARARAVGALIGRMPPDELSIALQEGLSQYCGKALLEATSSVPRTGFSFLDENRTRHGKLVEWRVGGTTTAMTGSANLSAAALLTTTVDGGNCELVTMAPIPTSLLPWEAPVDRSALSQKNTIPADLRADPTVTLVVLGARRVQHTITVELITTTHKPITLESSPNGSPDTWTALHVFTPDGSPLQRVQFIAPEQLGGAVRAKTRVGDRQVVSPVVFLTDTVRCRPRTDTTDQPRITFVGDDDTVLTDKVLAGRFNADLLRLLGHVQEHRAATATAPLRSTAVTASAADSDDRWGIWLESVERSLGPHLTGVLFPGALVGPGTTTTEWAVGPEANDSEITEGESDETIEDLADTPAEPRRTAPDIPTSQRSQYRAWARRWTKAATSVPRPPLELRMLVARTYLVLLAASVWGRDESWRPELRDLTCSLVPDADEQSIIPGQALDFLSSLMSACLALLLQDATLHGGGEYDVIAKSTWACTAELVAYADPELADEYLYAPDKPYARVPTWSEVKGVIDLAATAADDPYAEDRAALEQEDLPAEMLDGVWVVDGTFHNPRRVAARAATLVRTPSAVLARNEHKATVILSEGKVLAIAESAAPRWRVYELPPMSTPLSILAGDDGFPQGGKTYPLEPVPTRIQALAKSVGVNHQLLVTALQAYRPGPTRGDPRSR